MAIATATLSGAMRDRPHAPKRSGGPGFPEPPRACVTVPVQLSGQPRLLSLSSDVASVSMVARLLLASAALTCVTMPDAVRV